MGIRYNRLLLAGIVAGLVFNAGEFLANRYFLGGEWSGAMLRLGLSGEVTATQTVAFQIRGLALGIAAIWLYVAIRPRFGPGPLTAMVSGVAVWVLAHLLPMISSAVIDLLSLRLIVLQTGVALVQTIAGTLVGAWIYRENPYRDDIWESD